MTASKSPRAAAWEGLKRLVQDRVDVDAPVSEIFHWGIVKNPAKPRDPREDRANVLVATAILDQALEHALLGFFSRDGAEVRDQLFDSEAAPLRDLSAKIRLAYAFSLVGLHSRSDLSAIRRIRNAFAHSRLRLDFETPEVVAACDQISLPKRWANSGFSDEDARERFLGSCFEFALWLFTYHDIVRDKRASSEDYQLTLLRS